MTASRIAIAAYVLLGTISVFGQIPPPPPTGTTDPTTNAPQGQTTGGANRGQIDGNRSTKPKGGPAANGQNANGQNADGQNVDANGQRVDANGQKVDINGQPLTGPDIVDDPNATPEQKASAEYSGPAVLSRGISASSPMNPKNVKFTPSAGLEYTVNSGLTGVNIQSDGKLSNQLSQGVALHYGLVGEKVFKRDIFSLSFAGNLNHYFSYSSLDGTSNQLLLNWSHQVSKHLKFGMHETFQEYTQNNLLQSGAAVINSGIGSSLVTSNPATEAFDGRVINMYTQGDVTWLLNSRLSFNFSGGGFFTRRASTSLYGDTGYQATADASYRVTRNVNAGLYYSYSHFDYTGIYGGSDVNTVGFTYSVAFTRRTQLVTRIGGSRVETTGVSTIELDPFLALLFGTRTTEVAAYSKSFAPDLNLQIRHNVSNFDFSLAYSRGVTPGNGVILTSVRQNASFGVDYKARRHWNINNSAGYDTLSGFGTTNQKYASVYVGAGIYRSIARNLSWHTRFDFHHYTFDNTGFLRNSFVLSTGIAWSPGDLLERLW